MKAKNENSKTAQGRATAPTTPARVIGDHALSQWEALEAELAADALEQDDEHLALTVLRLQEATDDPAKATLSDWAMIATALAHDLHQYCAKYSTTDPQFAIACLEQMHRVNECLFHTVEDFTKTGGAK